MEKENNDKKKKRGLASRLFKVAAIIIVFVLALLLILPLFFKGALEDMAKEEINKNLKATVDFDRASLSFIRHFPSLTLDLQNLSVVGHEPFAGDTLAFIPSFSLTLNLRSLLGDGPIEVKRIMLHKPVVDLQVSQTGAVNWDVALPAEAAAENKQESSDEPFVMDLRRVGIQDGRLSYRDRELDMHVLMQGLQLSLSGDFSANQANISTDIKADQFTFNYEGIPYLSKVRANYQAIIEADFVNHIYNLKRNSLYLNDLLVHLDGSVGLSGDETMILLTFDTPKTEFKSLLSMIPAIYAHDFDQLKADGSFKLNGAVKGSYSASTMPAYNLDLKVNNGSFGYPDMPARVEKVNITLLVDNKTGQADDNVIKLERFDLELDNNPFTARLHLRTPVSDPSFDARMNGLIDLDKWRQLLALEQDEALSGQLQMDISLKGKMSDVEAHDFDQVTAMGSLMASNLQYYSPTFGLPVSISRSQMNFSPAYLDLVGFRGSIGESKLQISGRLQDYLAYYLAEGTLKGNLELKSPKLDANALMKAMENPEAETTTADTAVFTLELPERIDFRFAASLDTLLYDQFELTEVQAFLHYHDQRLVFEPMSALMLGGSLALNGYFDGADVENPFIDLRFGMESFSIPLAYQQLGMLQRIAPVAEQMTGTFSTQLNMQATLDGALNPVYESIRGDGKLQTSKLIISASETLIQLADRLGNDEYKRLSTDGLDFSYEIVNGRVFQEPMRLDYAGSNLTMGGSVGFDQNIDYEMLIELPYERLGPAFQERLSDLQQEAAQAGIAVDPGTTVNLKALLSGDVRRPELRIDHGDMLSDLRSSIQEKARQALEQQKEEAREKAREEAQKIMDEAQQRVDKLMAEAEKAAAGIRSRAATQAQNVRDEAEKQAAMVEMEGKQKGMVAELAAKETARRIRNEANNTAENLINEADKQANRIMEEAQKQADGIMKNAEERVERI